MRRLHIEGVEFRLRARVEIFISGGTEVSEADYGPVDISDQRRRLTRAKNFVPSLSPTN